jgi:hypothetical protein
MVKAVSRRRIAAFSFGSPVLAARMGDHEARRFASCGCPVCQPVRAPALVWQRGRQLFNCNDHEVNHGNQLLCCLQGSGGATTPGAIPRLHPCCRSSGKFSSQTPPPSRWADPGGRYTSVASGIVGFPALLVFPPYFPNLVLATAKSIAISPQATSLVLPIQAKSAEPLTMSSLEIADTVNLRYGNVRRTIGTWHSSN